MMSIRNHGQKMPNTLMNEQILFFCFVLFLSETVATMHKHDVIFVHITVVEVLIRID